MVGIKKLISDRTAKRGSFKRQCLQAKAKLKDVWRRPRGGQSKQRRQYKAKGRIPTPGFAGPVAVRGYHPCGLPETLVQKPGALASLDPQATAIRIGGTVGMKKRMVIQSQALEAGFKVLNQVAVAMEETSAGDEVTDDE